MKSEFSLTFTVPPSASAIGLVAAIVAGISSGTNPKGQIKARAGRRRNR